MIFVTGDTHGTKDATKLGNSQLKGLSRDDLLIICGDAGILFNPRETEDMLNLYSYLPYSVAFVDGNHENFDMLDSYPIKKWNEGFVHRISENVVHLMRGQVYVLEGRRFFAFGGGCSYDRHLRTPGTDWWSQEMPDKAEFDEGLRNIRRYNLQVNCVVTHDCPSHLLGELVEHSSKLRSYGVKECESNRMLESYSRIVSFDRWFFGHYHVDRNFGKYRCVFNDVVKV